MPIYLPETTARRIEALTPRQIVAELDKYVVGQKQAKRAVAIALRNRMRRQKLPAEMAEEVAPKNILMIGPTGVGKTEIARRLAKLAQSPFLKVEASKFTEVGYVGRDVESMIRDLVEIAVELVREERTAEVREKAKASGGGARPRSAAAAAAGRRTRADDDAERPHRTPATQAQQTRARSCANSCATGGSTTSQVEIDVREKSFPSFEIIAGRRSRRWTSTSRTCCRGLFQGRTRKRRVRVPEALEASRRKKSRSSIDMETRRARRGRARPAGRHHLPRRDRQDRRPREAATGPTSAAKACSATSCRSSKARR